VEHRGEVAVERRGEAAVADEAAAVAAAGGDNWSVTT
jgi:hypothetical protein